MAKFKRINPDTEIPKVAPHSHQIVAIGQNCYGRGLTEDDAVRHMKGFSPTGGTDYEVHVVPFDSEADDHPVNEDTGGYYTHRNCEVCR